MALPRRPPTLPLRLDASGERTGESTVEFRQEKFQPISIGSGSLSSPQSVRSRLVGWLTATAAVVAAVIGTTWALNVYAGDAGQSEDPLQGPRVATTLQPSAHLVIPAQGAIVFQDVEL